jgi:hypothetical protein
MPAEFLDLMSLYPQPAPRQPTVEYSWSAGPKVSGKCESDGYFQVTSMPKKCRKTSRPGRFLGFCCGLRR